MTRQGKSTRRIQVSHDNDETTSAEEQHDLLERAANNIGQGSSQVDANRNKQSRLLGEAASGANSQKGTPKTASKKKKRSLEDLPGFTSLKESGGGGGGGGGSTKKKQKAVVANVQLARYMQGPKKGQYSGKAFFCINCAFEDNKSYQALTKRVAYKEARWFPDWGKWAVHAPTPEIALKLFEAIKVDREMATTARLMNQVLDITPFDEPAITKPHMTLATSEIQFETRDGLLPRSIMIAGMAYDFKEYLKERWSEIRYTDLVFGGGATSKAAWVLPVSAETDETGTLADYLRELGVTVDEVDMDEDDDEDDEDERDGNEFVDDEAEEGEEDERM